MITLASSARVAAAHQSCRRGRSAVEKGSITLEHGGDLSPTFPSASRPGATSGGDPFSDGEDRSTYHAGTTTGPLQMPATRGWGQLAMDDTSSGKATRAGRSLSLCRTGAASARRCAKPISDPHAGRGDSNLPGIGYTFARRRPLSSHRPLPSGRPTITQSQHAPRRRDGRPGAVRNG
jgi:hypothetical protein